VASKTIEAAGGIVVRKGSSLGAGRLIAVVQRSKDDAWVLPRGKLKRDENPVAGARREVVEETGHRVEVLEYLGAITYRAGGRPKVVQFWHMEAEPEASHDLMPDIVAVEWLPLKAAVRRLSYPLEKLFLRHAAARALKKRRAEAKSQKAKSQKTKAGKTTFRTSKSGKAKPGKTRSKPAKVTSPKKKAPKSRSAAKIATKTKTATKTAGKPPRKMTPLARAAKAKARTRGRKKTEAERKARKPKKPKKPKTSKGKKAERLSSKTAALAPPAGQSPVTDEQAARPAAENPPAATKAGVVTTLPGRTGTEGEAGEHKTILQRMLGRIAG
jgi:8-oxo-dGTP diphosphatase